MILQLFIGGKKRNSVTAFSFLIDTLPRDGVGLYMAGLIIQKILLCFCETKRNLAGALSRNILDCVPW
jgi:hypothetical protein